MGRQHIECVRYSWNNAFKYFILIGGISLDQSIPIFQQNSISVILVTAQYYYGEECSLMVHLFTEFK